MARSKTLHFIRKRIEITQPNNPADDTITGEIDIASLLSKQLGRTIKQNQNFRVVGWGAYLTANPSADLDQGLATSVQLAFTPTTKWSKKGHKMLQDAYWKQSNFRKGLGVNSRYDEFEVSMFRGNADTRTSTVYVGGPNDPLAETCTLYGMYDADGSTRTISAQAMVDAKHPMSGAASRSGSLWEDDLIFDDIVNYKPAKFDSHFPQAVNLGCTATLSSMLFYDHDILVDEIYDGQGIASDSMHLLDNNHLNVLAGRVYYHTTVLPRDDENVLADGLYLYITLAVEGWSPLHYKPKKRLKRSRKTSRRRYRRSKK